MKKGYIISALAIGMVLVTGVAFAFWAGVINPKTGTDNSIVITVGEGGAVETTLNLSSASDATGKTLVPLTITPKAGETNMVTVTYTVNWTALEINGATGSISATNTSILLNGDEVKGTSLGDLFVFTFQDNGKNIAGNSSTSFVIKIQLYEPNATQYDQIAKGSVVFAFTFTVTDATAVNANI
jgi:hypothetical protein